MMKLWRTLNITESFLLSAVLTLLLLLWSLQSEAAPQKLAPMTSESTPLIVELNPVFILNAAAPTQTKSGTSLGWTGEVANGFGMLASFSIMDSRFDLETGAIYMNQISERNNSGTILTQETHNLHIPVLIRFNFDERVAIGFGGYGSFAKGNITTAQNSTSALDSYNALGIHNRDYGLLFSARASLKIVPQLYFIVDGRYQHGLTNLSNIPPGTAGDTLNTRSMQAYLGFSYRFIAF